MAAKQTDPARKIPDDIKAMSFEQAIAALEEIVNRLESGKVALEESIEIYKRGNQLRQHCDTKLKTAQAQIEKITGTDGDNKITTAPLDVD